MYTLPGFKNVILKLEIQPGIIWGDNVNVKFTMQLQLTVILII